MNEYIRYISTGEIGACAELQSVVDGEWDYDHGSGSSRFRPTDWEPAGNCYARTSMYNAGECLHAGGEHIPF